MFWLDEAAPEAAEHAQEAEHHTPIIVELVNHWFGESAHAFQLKHTKPKWDWLLGKFGSSAEAAFGPYTAENAIPRSEEHTSELQSQSNLVCRLLLEKKKNKKT